LMPHFTVMAPKDENELQHMLKTALNLPGPSVIRYPRGAGMGVPMDSALNLLPVGRGETLREGRDLAILAIGHMVQPAMEAAESLSSRGISAAVVNARFVKPLDMDWLLGVARRTPRLVTVEENSFVGGFGSAVKEALEGENASVRSIGLPDLFVEHGSQTKLRDKVGLSAEKLASRVEEFHRHWLRSGT